jgi:hypothetical protein
MSRAVIKNDLLWCDRDLLVQLPAVKVDVVGLAQLFVQMFSIIYCSLPQTQAKQRLGASCG